MVEGSCGQNERFRNMINEFEFVDIKNVHIRRVLHTTFRNFHLLAFKIKKT